MNRPPRVIEIHAAAPAKPAWGAPCNGCGVCCLSEPCPVGILVSRRTQGACTALLWDDATARYQCGMVVAPQRWWPLPWQWAQRLVARITRRWIAAGDGCDCSIELIGGPDPKD